ncbi:MAG: EexN family lipoprotein [Gammaproteobacteria bacterium]|nr:EexN family lipoprotein [Gammaproteobacteria bacterium]
MKAVGIKALVAATAVLVACSEPPPPRTVSQFMENPNLLEAALVRCTQNRSETRYDPECINAREAVRLTEVENEKIRRAELEAESQRKRDALRRTQRAAAEARRRAAEAERRREEAAYLAQFGVLPENATTSDEPMSGNAPLAVVPEAPVEETMGGGTTDSLPATGSNAPTVELAPEEQPPPSDLSSIRDELRRRGEEDNNQGN